MGRAVNFDNVPDTNLLPEGLMRLQIAEFDEVSTKTGKLMYKMRLDVIEPAEAAGMVHFENFVIGSDDDPDANEDVTWQKAFGARRMKAVLKAANIPMDTDMDNIMAAAVQQEFLGVIGQKREEQGEYAGQVRNTLGTCYALGQKEPGLKDGGAQAAPAPKAPPPAARPAAPAPKAAAPAPKAAPAAPAARPAPAPRPAAPAPRPTAAKASTVKCTICEEDVPRAELGDHVAAHAE